VLVPGGAGRTITHHADKLPTPWWSAARVAGMSEKSTYDESAVGPESLGIICGEDLDAVLSGEGSAVRNWAIGVLNTALELVVRWGPEANELLHVAAEVLWQFSGGDAGGSDQTAIITWLDGEQPRGRQWSRFAELVPAFVDSMNTMWASKAAKRGVAPISDENLPF